MSTFSSCNLFMDKPGMVAWNRLNEEIFGYDWAKQINEICKDLVENGDYVKLIKFQNIGKEPQPVPMPEHYLPLIYTLGVKDKRDSVGFF